MIRRLRRALALALLGTAVAAAPAPAHALLEATTPERGAALEAAPREVRLRFSEPVEIAFGAVRVYDAHGAQVQEGDAVHPGRRRPLGRGAAARRAPGRRLHGDVPRRLRRLPSGLRRLRVRRRRGRRPAARPPSASCSTARAAGPVTSVAFAAVRALQFAAIALAVGALAVLLLVWRPALAALAVPGTRRCGARSPHAGARVLLAAGAAGLAVSLLALPLQAATASGTTFWSALGALGDVLDTRSGAVWGLGALAWRARCCAPWPRAAGASRRVARGRRVPLAWLVCLPAARRARERAGPGRRAAARQRRARRRRLGLDRRDRGARGGAPGRDAAARAAGPHAAAHRRRRPVLHGRARRRSPPCSRAGSRSRSSSSRRSAICSTRPTDGRSWSRARSCSCCWRSAGRTAGGRCPRSGAKRPRGAPPGRAGRALRRALRVEVALGLAALAATGALAGSSPGDRAGRRAVLGLGRPRACARGAHGRARAGRAERAAPVPLRPR